jgi:putative GTP pyrophosphokinase
MTPQLTEEATQYEAMVPGLERFRESLATALEEQLAANHVGLAAPLESRVKSWESILGKLERDVARIQDFREYRDLVGLRIVVPFATDLPAAAASIRAACHVTEAHQTADRLADDRFGYQASHFVVKARQMRPATDGAFSTLTAEVQLLTAAQHVWAQSSHFLQYKSTEATPPELRRSVNRVAALLELVDLEFERLIQARESYRRSVQIEDDATILDVDVLDVALPRLWPREHPYDPSLNGMILNALTRHGIRTLGDLRRLIATQRSAVFADSSAQAQELLEAVDHGVRQRDTYTLSTSNGSRSHSRVTPELIARARRGCFYAISGLTFSALQFAFGERQPPPGTRVPFAPDAG